jgi:transposase InsO family protein
MCTPEKIAGWSMRETLHTEIALEALTMDLERQCPGADLLHPSDRGNAHFGMMRQRDKGPDLPERLCHVRAFAIDVDQPVKRCE